MNEEKSKNLLLYLAENITQLQLTKAMKLFFYADFVSFAETGQSITDLDYHAWDFGPVPPVMHRQLDKDKLGYARLLTSRKTRLVIPDAGLRADMQVFTEQEQKIIEKVLQYGKDKAVGQLTDESHTELPWAKTERYGKISYQWAKLLKTLIENKVETTDEEIIMEIIDRNPLLSHFLESSMADWLDTTSEDEVAEMIDENDLTSVHWEKGIGWVQGH